MEIVKRLSDRGATAEQIQHLQTQLGMELPNDYKEFLRTFNGGRPSLREFSGPSGDGSILHFFFTLDPGAEHYRLLDKIEVYRGRIPQESLPIASDPFGNLILLDLSAKSKGRIFFWDHEEEVSEDEESSSQNTAIIAESFTEFTDHLK